jgi:hypothetical protein
LRAAAAPLLEAGAVDWRNLQPAAQADEETPAPVLRPMWQESPTLS